MLKNVKDPNGKKSLISLKKNFMAIIESYYLKNKGNKMECCKPLSLNFGDHCILCMKQVVQ